MALELRLEYIGGSTPYAVIRRSADLYVWSLTAGAFVVWADADIDHYDVVLADQGGNLWAANMPAGLTAADVVVGYYDYASGTTAATTDLQWEEEAFYWNGSVVTDTPSGEALTTLARVKLYAGETGTANDAKYYRCLLAASRLVEKYCDRLFISDTYTEYVRPRAGRYAVVQAYPITSVDGVAVRRDAITFYNTSTTYERATVGYDGTSITLKKYASGVMTSNLFTLSAGYSTYTSLASTTIAAGSGWTATVLNSYGQWKPETTLGANQGTKDAKNGATLYLWDETLTNNFEWDANTPTIEGYFGCESWLKITYVGGYTTIPEEVQQATSALATALFRISTQDRTLKGERLGDYSWQAADIMAGDLPQLSPDAALLLAAFKRPRML